MTGNLPRWLSDPGKDFISRLQGVDVETLLMELDEIRDPDKKTNVRTIKKALANIGAEYSLKEPEPKKRGTSQDEIWAKVQASKKIHRCQCDLWPGMTVKDLPFTNSCTDPRYICPTVDRYRRLLEGIS